MNKTMNDTMTYKLVEMLFIVMTCLFPQNTFDKIQ